MRFLQLNSCTDKAASAAVVDLLPQKGPTKWPNEETSTGLIVGAAGCVL